MAAPEAPLYYQGVPRTSAAFRLLKQMGWQEGEGLGKEKQGITQHVRVSKKSDNSGVGIDAQQKAAANWTFNTSTFDNILKNLKVIAATDTNEEDNKRAVSIENNGMQQKAEESKAHPIKITRPQGRYKNREAGKILQGKSQDDLDAILGYRSDAKEVPPVIETSVRKSEKQISKTTVSSQSENQDLGSCKITLDSTVEVEQAVDVMSVNMPSDWWGVKHGFVRAGAFGQSYCSKVQKGLNQEAEIIRSNGRASFCEQDQEDLYKLVQDKATKGRQGLGIADRPKKIGGAHWKGQKVLLDSDNDEEDSESKELEDSHANSGNAANHGITDYCNGCDRKTEVKRKEAEPSSTYGTRNSKRLKEEDKANWKKLCKQLLREIPDQTISVKRLHKVIIEKSDLYAGLDADDHEGMIDLLKQKLNKSSKFILEGKRVSLASA